ncbi:MAG: hypothetical protein WCE38_20375 [Burkholderiales bacterium]
MVSLGDLINTINARVNRVLLYGETSLSESQFRAFRKLVLDEFGRSGLQGELTRLFEHREPQDRHGTGRPTHAGKEVEHD